MFSWELQLYHDQDFYSRNPDPSELGVLLLSFYLSLRLWLHYSPCLIFNQIQLFVNQKLQLLVLRQCNNLYLPACNLPACHM